MNDDPTLERDAELLWRFWCRERGGDNALPWGTVRTKASWYEAATVARGNLGAGRTGLPAVDGVMAGEELKAGDGIGVDPADGMAYILVTSGLVYIGTVSEDVQAGEWMRLAPTVEGGPKWARMEISAAPPARRST